MWGPRPGPDPQSAGQTLCSPIECVAAMGFLAPVGLDWSPWSEPTRSQPVRDLGAALTISHPVTDLPVWKPALVPRGPGRTQGECLRAATDQGPEGQGWVQQRPCAHSREKAADGQHDPPGHRSVLPHRPPLMVTLFSCGHITPPQVPPAPQLLAWEPLLPPWGHQGWRPLSTPCPGLCWSPAPAPTLGSHQDRQLLPIQHPASWVHIGGGGRSLGQTPSGLPKEDRKAAVGRPRAAL